VKVTSVQFQHEVNTFRRTGGATRALRTSANKPATAITDAALWSSTFNVQGMQVFLTSDTNISVTVTVASKEMTHCADFKEWRSYKKDHTES